MARSARGRSNLIALCLVILGTVLLMAGDCWCAPDLRENAVVRAVRKVGAAVVNISSEYEVAQRSNPFFNFGLDPFFESFFKDFFEPRYRRQYKGTSLGSGVIIDGNRGYILTNEHVIARSTKIKVVLNDEREFEAELVGAAPDFDLAVLKIKSKKPLPAIEMGNSNDLMIGESVIAIGNPFGFSHTVTTGVISATNRSVQTDDRVYRDFIQTDASINPGNSGGPLLNIKGDFIGINTAIYSKAQGIGFAIPVNKARRVMDDLIKYGEVHIPWLGLFVQDLNQKLARYFRTPEGHGVLISDVSANSPAQKAGLQKGDVVTAIGKRRVTSKKVYHAIIKNFGAGKIIPLTVWRDGKTSLMQIRSRTFPEELADELAYKSLGVRVREVSAALRLRFSIAARNGVMVTELRPGSYLDRVGARSGDVIRKIDEVVIRTLADFKKAVIKYRQRQSAVLLIQRDKQQYHVTVKLEA
ncbi:MAG: Do family serine endopeptidase [Desulfobacterales bacterium]|nr:Do family serine endopeptidase [Desulfobacterales bacterium]